jgi:Flp pilus assembly protein TadG
MMKILRSKNIAHDEKGVTVVEFALILPVALTLLLGSVDLGWQMYASSMAQGSLQRQARLSALENASFSAMKSNVKTDLKVFADASDISITAKSYKSFTGIGAPEKITTDIAPLNAINVGDCYIDSNNNGSYDTAQGSDGIGTSEDAVVYEMTMSYERLMPFSTYIGMQNPVVIKRKAIVKNEPFSGIIDPPTRCVT